MKTFTLRLATSNDASEMLAIYTPYVLETCISFEIEPPSLNEFTHRIESRKGKLPWLVALDDETRKIAGYAYTSPFGERAGFAWSVEGSVYVDKNLRKSGIGRRLYLALQKILQAQGYYNLYALVAEDTEASALFHQKLGFEKQGVLTEVGFKLGQFVPLAYYCLPLHPPTLPPQPPLALAELPEEIILNILQSS